MITVTSPAWEPDADQRILPGVIRRLLVEAAPSAPGPEDAPGEYDAALWQRLATEIGLGALGVPEELDGAGGDYRDVHLALVELGRTALASPYPATAVATQALLLATGDDDERRALLARLAEGAPGAVLSGLESLAGQRVQGETAAVLDGARAEILLLLPPPAQPGELLSLETDAPGLSRTVLATMDQSLHLARVTADDVPARSAGRLDEAARHRLEALDLLVATAIQVGGARRCLEMTVQYLQDRQQFGRPLGSFQALKHRVADLLVAVETAESASWAAAAAWVEGADDAEALAAIAFTHCAEAYRTVAGETIQMHGGIAITWEHEAHRHFKQAHTWATVVGSPAAVRARLAARLGLEGPELGG